MPSSVSNAVRTLGAENGVISQTELLSARSVLNGKVVELSDAQSITSTSVRLDWQLFIQNNEDFIEGLYIRYRDLNGGSQKYNIITVLNPMTRSYVVANLKKFTNYEFFISPFYRSVEGQPSNSKIVQTLQDIPSAPPDNVQTGMLNLTAGWVRWSPPPQQHHNGVLLGYKIQIKAGNSSKVLAQMTLNTTTMSVMLNNLTTGITYNIRVVAYTRVGAGPYSQPISLVMDPAHLISPPRAHPSGTANVSNDLHQQSNLVHETWFLIVVLTIFSTIVVFCAGLVVFIRRKQQQNKELNHLSGKI